MLGRHGGGGGRRHHRRHGGHRRSRPINYYPSYPYGYGYGYDPYWNYSNYREPSYGIVNQPQQLQQPEPEQTMGSRLGLQIPTIAVSLLLSYLLWGKRAG